MARVPAMGVQPFTSANNSSRRFIMPEERLSKLQAAPLAPFGEYPAAMYAFSCDNPSASPVANLSCLAFLSIVITTLSLYSQKLSGL